MSYFRFFSPQYTTIRTSMRKHDKVCFVVCSSHFRDKKCKRTTKEGQKYDIFYVSYSCITSVVCLLFLVKTRQIRDESTTRKSCCTVAHLCRIFAFLPRKFKKAKTRRYDKFCRVFAFLLCCILRRKSENMTWRKSATILKPFLL